MGKLSEKDPLDIIKRLEKRLTRKEREIAALKTNSRFLETIFNGIPEEIMVVDRDFNVQDVNKVFLDHYGLEKRDCVGRKCYAIIHHSDSPCSSGNHVCPLERARKTGKRIEVEHYSENQDADGKELIRIMYPLAAEDEMPEFFVEITQNVTEYRNLIRRLKASEKKFKAILDTATDAILSIDKNHKIVLFNNAAEQIFGYNSSEVLGKSLNMIIPFELGDNTMLWERLFNTEESRVIGETLLFTAVRKGGEEFPVMMGLSFYEMEGSPFFTAIIRDVSMQKQLEKKLLRSERLAAVGQTVAHVAHEIKNPLMIIGGFSHQMRRALTDEDSIQKLDMIFDEIRRLEKLVANLGDFTKEYKLMKRLVDINDVIKDVLKIIAGIYSTDAYVFQTDLFPDLGEIKCDPDKLKQVFINVIANGMEAMDSGGTIKVCTEPWARGVEVRIIDEGVGINEEDLLRIFEPFYTTSKTGSGLGLSISYKIIEAHEGDIFALSLPGEGTTFVIRLPSP